MAEFGAIRQRRANSPHGGSRVDRLVVVSAGSTLRSGQGRPGPFRTGSATSSGGRGATGAASLGAAPLNTAVNSLSNRGDCVIGLGPRGRLNRRRGLTDVPWSHTSNRQHLRKGAARVTAPAERPSDPSGRNATGPLLKTADGRATEEDRPFGGIHVASLAPLLHYS
jgi:hypothetical protein